MMRLPARIWDSSNRLAGLRRFAFALTAFNLLGHTVLGFEQSWAQPLAAILTAYALELLLEVTDAWARHRPRRFASSPRALLDFLLPAHITGLAVSMLLYANEQIAPVVFATAAAMASKWLLRAPVGPGTRHFFNPSNLGISVTLLLFPWVGIAPPYQFTANIDGPLDWLLPAFIIVSGTLINYRFTGRLPLLLAWLAGFAAQGIIRSLVLGTPVVAALLPMTGLAFILYTFYMVTDPATTPQTRRGQVGFGLAVASVYSCLLLLHVVFGLFFALTIVCAARGVWLYWSAWYVARSAARDRPVLVGEVAS